MLEVKKFFFLLLLQMKKLVLARPFEIDSTTGQTQKFCGRCGQGRMTENRDPEHPPFGAQIPQDLPPASPENEEKGTVLTS